MFCENFICTRFKAEHISNRFNCFDTLKLYVLSQIENNFQQDIFNNFYEVQQSSNNVLSEMFPRLLKVSYKSLQLDGYYLF